MTGNLNINDYFLLTKYYQKILASVRNIQIVLEPEGWIKPGK